MTTSEYSAIVGGSLLAAVMSFAIWRVHGVAGLKRVLPGFAVAFVSGGVGLLAGRLIGPEWTGIVMVTLVVGLLGIGIRVAPRYFNPTPVSPVPLKIRRPRLIAVAIGIALSTFLFAVPGRASTDPVNIGLAILMGVVAAAASYWSASRRMPS